jgi:hypothetical protein
MDAFSFVIYNDSFCLHIMVQYTFAPIELNQEVTYTNKRQYNSSTRSVFNHGLYLRIKLRR